MPRTLLFFILILCASLAFCEKCEGVFRDYVYSVDASRIEEVRLTSRVGAVVIQKPPDHAQAARSPTVQRRDEADEEQNQYYVESGETGDGGTATDNITVLVRVKATDNETLDSMRVSLGSSFGVFTAMAVCVSFGFSLTQTVFLSLVPVHAYASVLIRARTTTVTAST